MTTLHDIIYLEKSYSQILGSSATSYQKFGNVYRKLVVPTVVRKSAKVITVSNFEKQRISEYFNLEEKNNLSAVYNGVGSHFKPINDLQELQRVKQEYDLPDQFLFFLGNTDPKKNTKGTLKAYSDFRLQHSSNYKLVMLDYDPAELQKMANEIGDPDLINHIVLTGYVQNADLPVIYSLCSIFLYPSLRESFGIPILEAMSCGVPVITSNTSSMPEVAGGAAHLVNPQNVIEITAGMIKIGSDDGYRERLIQKGLNQVKKFSWQMTAKKVLANYKQLYRAK